MDSMMMMMPVPIGFRFNPSEEELIGEYLWARVLGTEVPWDGVVEKELYGARPPWEVFNDGDFFHSKIRGAATENITFVFTTLTRPSKIKFERRAGCGTWSGRTKPTQITCPATGQIIGHMRYLYFKPDHAAAPPPDSAHWTMHEYSLSKGLAESSGVPNAANIVICKITKSININIHDNNMLPLPPPPEVEQSSSAPPSKKQKMITFTCGGAEASNDNNNNMLPLPPPPPPEEEQSSSAPPPKIQKMITFTCGGAEASNVNIDDNNNNMLPAPEVEQSSSAPPSEKQKMITCAEASNVGDQSAPFDDSIDIGEYMQDDIDLDELHLECFPNGAPGSGVRTDWNWDIEDVPDFYDFSNFSQSTISPTQTL